MSNKVEYAAANVDREFATMRSESEMRSWLADNGCPEVFANRLIEQRMGKPGFKPAQAAQPTETSTVLDRVRDAAIL